MTFERVRLGSLAEVAVSNVDKHSVDGQPIVRLCNYTDVYYQHALDQSREYMVATASPDQIQKFRLQVDDVVITKDSEAAEDIGIPALITETADDFVCGYHLAILRPNPQKTDGRYLNWALQSDDLKAQFENIAFGVTRVGLKTGRIKTLEIPVPGGPAAQARVADYLDRETATIDALIEKQTDLIAALRERRSATIEKSLLTAGSMVPVKRCAELLPGYAFSSSDFVQNEEGPRLLRGINVKPGNIDWTESVSLNRAATPPSGAYVLKEGDVVLGMDRPFISGGTRVALIDANSMGALLVQRVLRLRPTAGVDSRVLTHALGGTDFRTQVETEFTGISVPHLSESQVGRVRIPMPPANEQREIADHLDRETAKIDALIAKAERFIELAQERRAALITAAVTGQIEIPTED
ncbi:restriction endonuclease subunit S [Micrococcus luteus]|uniref:restriction endonuclease subunit S n=2 Tax=Micrococcus luteus TaxID=1270 RepID=UPI003D356A3C